MKLKEVKKNKQTCNGNHPKVIGGVRPSVIVVHLCNMGKWRKDLQRLKTVNQTAFAYYSHLLCSIWLIIGWKWYCCCQSVSCEGREEEAGWDYRSEMSVIKLPAAAAFSSELIFTGLACVYVCGISIFVMSHLSSPLRWQTASPPWIMEIGCLFELPSSSGHCVFG